MEKMLPLILLLIGFASAVDYYVSVDGTAVWPACSNIDTPCSWQTAVNSAIAGDTVYFREGTYDPGAGKPFQVPAMNPGHSGTAGAPIIFTVYPGESATILEASYTGISGTAPSIGGYLRSWIIWDGFRLTRNLDNGYGASQIVNFDMCDNCIIRDCDISGGKPHMDHTNGVLISVLNSVNVSIYNNTLHDMFGAENPDQATVNTGAMWIFDKAYVYVYNNDIYNVDNGIQSKDGVSYLYAYRNHIWNCSRSAFQIIPQTEGVTDFIFYQNIIRDCQIALNSPDPARIINNLKFYNNAIYNSGTLAVIGDPDYKNHRGAEVYNNIFFGRLGDSLFARYYEGLGYPAFADYNLYHGQGHWNLDYDDSKDFYSLSSWTLATGSDAHSLSTDPLFANPGGKDPQDYRLQAGSPALMAGIDRQDYDHDGDTMEKINMGAFITGDEVIGVADSGMTLDELLEEIEKWKRGDVTITSLLNAIRRWKESA